MCFREYKLLGFKDRRELNKFNHAQTKVCMKMVAAIGAKCKRSTAPFHDSVVQTGETCCAIDMTEYEKTS